MRWVAGCNAKVPGNIRLRKDVRDDVAKQRKEAAEKKEGGGGLVLCGLGPSAGTLIRLRDQDGLGASFGAPGLTNSASRTV